MAQPVMRCMPGRESGPGGRMRGHLAVEVDGVQAHDVLVAQLAQQHDLADGGRRDALALLARLEGLHRERARLVPPRAR